MVSREIDKKRERVERFTNYSIFLKKLRCEKVIVI